MQTRKNVSELLDLLEQGVQSITSGESFQNYLRVMAKFPHYSARNNMLIYLQFPQATLVAGYATWKKKFGRHVKKGEKGIRILAPYTYATTEKDPHSEEYGHKVIHTGFRSIVVFDYSQTEGNPLPQPDPPQLLKGEFQQLDLLIRTLSKVTGYEIEAEFLDDSINGRCHYQNRRIYYSSTLSSSHAAKTLIHETAHSLLHGPCHLDEYSQDPYLAELSRNQALREIEAESVSFVVCQILGIDSSEYSFPYIAAWKQENSFLQNTMERIARTAQLLMAEIELDFQLTSFSCAEPEIAVPAQAAVSSREPLIQS